MTCCRHRALSNRLAEFEARQDSLSVRISDAPQDVPGTHLGIAETYRRRIDRLTAALAHLDAAAEAAEAILDRIDRTGKSGYKPAPDAASTRLSVSGQSSGLTRVSILLKRRWIAGSSPAMATADQSPPFSP
jgi:hypothetical protein